MESNAQSNQTADVHVALHEAAERSVVDSAGYIKIETCPGQYFRVTEVFSADRDDAFVRKRVGLLRV